MVAGAAESLVLRSCSNILKVAGYVTIRGLFDSCDVFNIVSSLNTDMVSHFKHPNTDLAASGVIERNRILAEIVYSKQVIRTMSKILGDFWLWGSDACLNYTDFCLHRDLFTNPPIYKAFIALHECIFLIVPGTHHYHDSYSQQIGQYLTQWDTNRGRLNMDISDVCYQKAGESISLISASGVNQEALTAEISLHPGDVFIFNVNCIHGLRCAHTENNRHTFLSFSVVNRSSEFLRFGFQSRTEMIETLMDIRIAALMEEYRDQRGYLISPKDAFTLDMSDSVREYVLADSELSKTARFLDVDQDTITRAIRRVSGIEEEYLRGSLPRLDSLIENSQF